VIRTDLAQRGLLDKTIVLRADEMGMGVVETQLDIPGIHAAVLGQLGIDRKRLTFRFGGRDVRLTDVKGRIIRDLLS
jgi:hypothetical protein